MTVVYQKGSLAITVNSRGYSVFRYCPMYRYTGYHWLPVTDNTGKTRVYPMLSLAMQLVEELSVTA